MLPQSLPGDIRCSDTFKSRFPTQNPGKAPCLAHTDRLDGNQRPLVPRFGSFFPQNPHAHFEVPISVEIILRGCRDNDGLGGSARRFLRGLCIYQGTTAQSQFQNHPKLPLCTQLEAQFWKKNSCFPSPRAAQVPPCFWMETARRKAGMWNQYTINQNSNSESINVSGAFQQGKRIAVFLFWEAKVPWKLPHLSVLPASSFSC